MNLPGQAKDDLVGLAKFYIENKPYKIHLFCFSYFPKVELIDIAKDRGLLSEEEIKKINEGYSSDSYFLGKTSSDKKFLMLFLLINILPKRISRYVVNNKLYSLICNPAINYNYLILYYLTFNRLKKVTFLSKDLKRNISATFFILEMKTSLLPQEGN